MFRPFPLALLLSSLALLPQPVAAKSVVAEPVKSEIDQLIERADTLNESNRFEEASAIARDIMVRLDVLAPAPDWDKRSAALSNASYTFRGAGLIAEERAAILRHQANYEAEYGKGSEQADWVLGDLANTFRREGRTGEGEKLLRETLAARKAALPPGDERIVKLLFILSEYLESASRLAGAAEAQREMLALQTTYHADKPGEILKTTRNLCWSLGQLGRTGESIPILRAAIPQAEALWRSTGATDEYNGSFDSMFAAMMLADFQQYLADHLGMEGPSAEADELFAKSLAWRNRYQSRPTPIVARAYNAMAFRQNFQGRFAEAEENATIALDIMGEPDEPNIVHAKYKYNLAAALLGQGKAEEAIPLLRYGVPVQRAEFPDDHPDLAILLSTLASALAAVPGNEDEAVTLAAEAAAIARKHRDARVLGGYKDSAADPGAAALTRAIGGDASTRDPLSMAYGAVLRAAWPAMAKAEDDSALSSAAFMAAQDLEQSVAGQAMAEAAARALGGTGPLGRLVSERQALVGRTRALNAALPTALASGEATRITRSRAELDEAVAALAKADAAIARDFPDYQALTSPAALDIAAVQARLKADEALVLLVPYGPDIFSFGISKDRVHKLHSKDAVAPVNALVRRMRCRVDEASCTSEADLDASATSEDRSGIDEYFPRFDRQSAFVLYRELLKPLEPAIGTAKTLYVTASGDLSGIPFQMLVTDLDDKEDAEAGDVKTLLGSSWLGEKVALVNLPSVSALRALRPLGLKGGTGFLGYGAPALLGQSAAVARGSKPRRPKLRSGVMTLGSTGPDALRQLDALPGTETELKAIATVLAQKLSELRLGAAATESAFRADPRLSDARVIAIATHGLLPREMDFATEPGLVFTPPAIASATDDGLLTASEAAQLKLNAEWVILSACNTASADGTPGAQSLSGLARAFLHAGAKALLASHWRVSDEVTAALMAETLRLREGGKLARPQALQQAMRAVRTGKRQDGSPMPGWKPHWAHPAAWAPFILVAGDGD